MNRYFYLKTFILSSFLLLSGCDCNQQSSTFLPASMLGKVEVVDYCKQNCEKEILNNAIKEEDKGGLSSGTLIRLTADINVYRMWDGPSRVNEYGATNRIGPWWTSEHPNGKADEYRVTNAICPEWNELTWVAKCTLKKGSLVAIGPTQSANCQKGEHYPANNSLQIYIDNYSGNHVECKKYVETDYEANPNDIYLAKNNPNEHLQASKADKLKISKTGSSN